jgi:hypothetical protein
MRRENQPTVENGAQDLTTIGDVPPQQETGLFKLGPKSVPEDLEPRLVEAAGWRPARDLPAQLDSTILAVLERSQQRGYISTAGHGARQSRKLGLDPRELSLQRQHRGIWARARRVEAQRLGDRCLNGVWPQEIPFEVRQYSFIGERQRRFQVVGANGAPLTVICRTGIKQGPLLPVAPAANEQAPAALAAAGQAGQQVL